MRRKRGMGEGEKRARERKRWRRLGRKRRKWEEWMWELKRERRSEFKADLGVERSGRTKGGRGRGRGVIFSSLEFPRIPQVTMMIIKITIGIMMMTIITMIMKIILNH